jgi:hypothetical protein
VNESTEGVTVHGILITVLLGAALLGLLYRRFQFFRMRHPVRPVAMVIRVLLMSTLAVVAIRLPFTSPPLLAGAIAVGACLGLYALTRVEFAQGERRTLYQSKSRVGMIIFALFTARLVWRVTERVLLGKPAWFRRLGETDGATALEQTPITFILLGVVIGYSVCLTTGVLLRSRTAQAA